MNNCNHVMIDKGRTQPDGKHKIVCIACEHTIIIKEEQ